MAELSVLEMIASLRQKQERIAAAIQGLEGLAGIEGDSRFLSVNGSKRRVATKQKNPGKPGPGTVNDLIFGAIRAAKEPLSTQEITDWMFAKGWTTASTNPKTVVAQALYHLRKGKKLRREGKKGNGHDGKWGLPEWKKAMQVRKALEE